MHSVIRKAALRRGALLWFLVRFGGVIVVAVVASTGTVALTPPAIAGMAPGALLVVAAMAVADEHMIRREGTLLQNVGTHRFAIVGRLIIVAALFEVAFLVALAAVT